jgi:hypothetical protein
MQSKFFTATPKTSLSILFARLACLLILVTLKTMRLSFQKTACAVLSAIRWCSRHLALLFRQRHPPQLGHLSVPPEIILMIVTHLDKTSITSISLALTCWTLFHLCFPRSPELSLPEKQDFLLLLEKDVAHLYFCHFCVKIHRWRKSWFRDFLYYMEDPYSGGSCKLQSQFYGSDLYYLPYQFARIVMNRHFYGAAHGVPVRELEEYHVRRLSSGLKTCSTWHARIIDDQLMLSLVLTLSHNRGDAKLLRHYIDEKGPWVCDHLPTTTCYQSDRRYRVPELAMNSSSLDYFLSCNQSFKSCPVYMTDYCINIGWHGSAKG